MEEVTRMTYNELYYFQKTLTETGQIVLANSVPVKTVPLPERNDADDQSIVVYIRTF